MNWEKPKEAKMDMAALENEYEWVSISTMAKRMGVSGQTIRNRIKEGFFDTLNFERGAMKGILIRVSKWQDKSGK